MRNAATSSVSSPPGGAQVDGILCLADILTDESSVEAARAEAAAVVAQITSPHHTSTQHLASFLESMHDIVTALISESALVLSSHSPSMMSRRSMNLQQEALRKPSHCTQTLIRSPESSSRRVVRERLLWRGVPAGVGGLGQHHLLRQHGLRDPAAAQRHPDPAAGLQGPPEGGHALLQRPGAANRNASTRRAGLAPGTGRDCGRGCLQIKAT